jgi:hypothetical protein
LPSINDLLSACDLEKYSIVLGKDGLMIIKQTGYNREDKIMDASGGLYLKWMDSFHKNCKKDIETLRNKYPNWLNVDTPDGKSYDEENHKLLTNYLTKHIKGEVSSLNKKFHTKKYNVKMDLHYVPKNYKKK